MWEQFDPHLGHSFFLGRFGVSYISLYWFWMDDCFLLQKSSGEGGAVGVRFGPPGLRAS